LWCFPCHDGGRLLIDWPAAQSVQPGSDAQWKEKLRLGARGTAAAPPKAAKTASAGVGHKRHKPDPDNRTACAFHADQVCGCRRKNRCNASWWIPDSGAGDCFQPYRVNSSSNTKLCILTPSRRSTWAQHLCCNCAEHGGEPLAHRNNVTSDMPRRWRNFLGGIFCVEPQLFR